MEQDYRPSKDLRDSTVIISSTTTALGTTTTLIDTITLTQGDDYWNNMAVVILSGSSIGQVRRISDFETATDKITVDTAFASVIASGTKYNIVTQHSPAPSSADATAANQVLILTDTATIKADSQVIEDSTLKAAPTAGSLARFIASGGTALGTQLPDSKSLYDCLSGGVSAVNTTVGTRQVFEKSITANANAGATVVGTVATQACVIESVIIYANTNGALPASTTAATTDGLTGVAGAITFLDAGIALTANLDTAGDQVSWTAGSAGAVRLAVGYQIITTLAGGGANPTDLTFVITYYSSAANGGTIS